MRRRMPGESFADFERRLHQSLQELERELLGEDLCALLLHSGSAITDHASAALQ